MDDSTIPIPSVELPLSAHGAAFSMDPRWEEKFSYQALFDQTGECIFIISLDFHYLTANRQALDLLGYRAGELAGMPVDEVVSQDDHPEPRAPGESPPRLQERILKRKDGSTVPVEISTTIVYGADKQPAYIQSVARDISARKRAERLLKRNAEVLSVISEATARLLRSSDIDARLPALLEALGRTMGASCCAIFTFDPFAGGGSARVRYLWNETGLPEASLAARFEAERPALLEAGEPVFQSNHPEGRSGDAADLSLVVLAMERAFGSTGYLAFLGHAADLPWPQAELDALQTAANLISAALQRRRYEETIRLSEMRNRIIVDALPDLILRVDVGGKVLDYSANPSHPLYIHRDLASGRTLDTTFPREIAERILGKENREAFVAPQKAGEFQLPYAQGTYEASLYPICPEEALVVIRDVTEQVELNEMKSDFINRASHELRTPLTSALLMIDLIQEGGTEEEVAECWRTLKGELGRQKELIDRLLMAGRLESGMLKVEARRLDLLPVLRESLQAVQAIASRRDISLVMSHEVASCPIWGDPGGLQQVFVNLINNAAKFSPPGSQVEIALSRDESEARVAIADKGIGIPQEDLPHLFERFYRAKNVTVAEIPGSGIGLFIVNSIVRELGGRITVESVQDRGTTFTVHLRRAGPPD